MVGSVVFAADCVDFFWAWGFWFFCYYFAWALVCDFYVFFVGDASVEVCFVVFSTDGFFAKIAFVWWALAFLADYYFVGFYWEVSGDLCFLVLCCYEVWCCYFELMCS